MFVQIIIALALGVTFGIFTGLVPGIHINLISVMVLSSSDFLLNFFTLPQILVFILAMSITHTFIDSIPSIYLGAPDESQALLALPGHKMLLKGEGHNAVLLTVIGSFFTLLLSFLLIWIFIFLMQNVYPLIKAYTGYIIIVILVFIFALNKTVTKISKAIFIFFFSGLLGLIVLNMKNLSQPLFPLLSGLFGTSLLLLSFFESSTIPTQNLSFFSIRKSIISKSVLGASIAGFFSAFLPGFGASQAAILSSVFLKDLGDEGFIILVGGLNTASMLISLATFFALSKARNGSIVVMKELLGELNIFWLIIFLLVSIIVAGVASILAIKISRKFSDLIQKVNYKLTVGLVILFIVILSIYFDGVLGLIILITSSSLGILTTKLKVGKNNLMGCLILSVIFYFVL